MTSAAAPHFCPRRWRRIQNATVEPEGAIKAINHPGPGAAARASVYCTEKPKERERRERREKEKERRERKRGRGSRESNLRERGKESTQEKPPLIQDKRHTVQLQARLKKVGLEQFSYRLKM